MHGNRVLGVEDRFSTAKAMVKPSLLTLILSFYQVHLRKIPEMSSNMEECKVPAWARDKMFPSPDRLAQHHPVRVAESCESSCNSVLYAKSHL